jgi:amino acid adenylation domain-containing protein/thioester reductase-like protein
MAIGLDIPDERAKYMMENSQSKVILTTKEFDRKIGNLEKIFIDINDNELYNNEFKENLSITNKPTDIIHIIYTSGTTGLPKGNMIPHRGIVRLVKNTNYSNLEDKDVMVVSGSVTFDTSGFEVWGALLYGMTLHLIKKQVILNPLQYEKYLKENKITTTLIPTPIFNQLVEYNPSMFENMKEVYICGDVLLNKYSNAVFNACRKTRFVNVYGPAENTVLCTAQTIDKTYLEDIPIGKVTSNSTSYVVDKCGNLCPIGVPGNLYVGGDGLSLGYINKPDLTKEKFIEVDFVKEKLYVTGDLTSWYPNGSIKFFGRIDSQVKIRGQRVELLEIQKKILELEEINEAIVKVYKENENYLVAYYTSKENISDSIIKEYLKKYLPAYMIPYKFVQIDKMPFNHNGKIDMKALPPVGFDINIEKLIKPENVMQEKILNAFKKVLNKNNIGMSDSFFEVGGDSLLAIRLVTELLLNDIKVTYKDIFECLTPALLYEKIYNNKESQLNYDDVEKYDYTTINKLLSNNSINDDDCYNVDDKYLGDIILTGATGFLGAHILSNFIDNKKGKAYCIIRSNEEDSAEDRLRKRLNFFFGDKYNDKFNNRIIVIEGDITKNNFGIDSKELNNILKNITTVINSAAYVKHYGDSNLFYSINVLGTQNAVDFCLKNKKELIHISTLSVSGNMLEGGVLDQDDITSKKDFTERDLYIGQNLNNIYVYTKFIAERIILENVISKGFKAKIIRAGNLTGRFSDGKFQPNVEENAFANRIKALLEIKVIPNSLTNIYIELTPIDYISDAIIKLSSINTNKNVFHLYNYNHITFSHVINILNNQEIEIKVVQKKEFSDIIKMYLNNPIKVKMIENIISDFNENFELDYKNNITVKCDFTKEILKKNKFYWPDVEKEYFLKYVNYLRNIGFLSY